jgi:hypothetical protein
VSKNRDRRIGDSEFWPVSQRHRARIPFSATMLRLKRAQRATLADKLPDLANLAAGALVFSQFLTEHFSVPEALAGVAIWGALMAWAIRFAGGVK